MNEENTNPLGAIVDKVNDVAAGLINKIPGPAATPNAAVAAETDPKAALERALEEMTLVLQVQARDALVTLAGISEVLAKKGEQILRKTAEVGILYASGKIDKDSAALAVDNYIAALTLLGVAEVNSVKVQAYLKAVKTLQAVKSILLSLVQVGLNMLVPSLGTWVGGLDLTALFDSIIKEPKTK
jgi:hypothetical protein